MAIELAAEIGDPFDELGIGTGEAVLVPAHVVFETGAAMTAKLERPAIELDLMATNPGRGPSRLGHELRELRHFKLEHVAQGGHRVLDPEHELDVKGRRD